MACGRRDLQPGIPKGRGAWDPICPLLFASFTVCTRYREGSYSGSTCCLAADEDDRGGCRPTSAYFREGFGGWRGAFQWREPLSRRVAEGEVCCPIHCRRLKKPCQVDVKYSHDDYSGTLCWYCWSMDHHPSYSRCCDAVQTD